MNAVRSFLIAASSAKINGEYKCTHTGADMYDVSAGKINRTDGSKESALTPYHMCHRIIYDDGPEGDKSKKCFEFHSSHNCAGNERRCDHSKHHLECGIHKMRYAVGVRTGIPAYTV